ncbi:MAG: hypothetical protein Q9162_006810 [Coniocarpon cinnabarinum]
MALLTLEDFKELIEEHSDHVVADGKRNEYYEGAYQGERKYLLTCPLPALEDVATTQAITESLAKDFLCDVIRPAFFNYWDSDDCEAIRRSSMEPVYAEVVSVEANSSDLEFKLKIFLGHSLLKEFVEQNDTIHDFKDSFLVKNTDVWAFFTEYGFSEDDLKEDFRS